MPLQVLTAISASSKTPPFIAIIIFILTWSLFLGFQAHGITGGDSGDLVTAAATFGVPHPPGYPLYTLLGWLLTRLPVFSVSWRVALISSFSHALTVTLVFLLCRRLTGFLGSGLFAAMLLAGNYLFFLYSVTPEVFALLDLFIVGLLYLAFSWVQTGRAQYWWWLVLVFGLALSHHHVIVFFLPALFWYVFSVRLPARWLGKSVIWLWLGLLPYAYLPIAARGVSIINWNRPVDWSGFLRLVTRADYGTFVSGPMFGKSFTERWLALQAYSQFALLDFTIIGALLAGIGIIFLWRRDRRLAQSLILGLIWLGPGFFYYASFPLVNRFSLGTYERFLLPSYLLFSIIIGLGFYAIYEFLVRLAARLAAARLLPVGVSAIMFLYPLLFAGMTVYRFWGLPGDLTADYLGRDILDSLPPSSILLLARDTPLFTTQYVRYALGHRSDIIALHANRFFYSPDYLLTVTVAFPDLQVPAAGENFVSEFLAANLSSRRLFSTVPYRFGSNWSWEPYGLVYELKKAGQPDLDAMIKTNDGLWQNLHDPNAGILNRYNHLMLSDIREPYVDSKLAYGKFLLKHDRYGAARKQFLSGIELGSDTLTSEGYALLGASEYYLHDCRAAESAFVRAGQVAYGADPDLFLYQALVYRDCFSQPEAAARLLDQYEQARRNFVRID